MKSRLVRPAAISVAVVIAALAAAVPLQAASPARPSRSRRREAGRPSEDAGPTAVIVQPSVARASSSCAGIAASAPAMRPSRWPSRQKVINDFNAAHTTCSSPASS